MDFYYLCVINLTMQNAAKSKGLFLAIGIFVGMLVAFGIVWFDFERISERFIGQVQKVFTKSDKGAPDTVKVIIEKEVQGRDNDNDIGNLPPDTLAADTLMVDSLSLMVKKDELLYTKNIKLITLGDKGKGAAVDSAMAKAADVDPSGLPAVYSVEFWKSPINYKGYKLGRSKLVLFGIYQSDDISLVSIGNSLFLKNRDFYFRLEPTEDFCSFNPVTDRNLLAQLSQ